MSILEKASESIRVVTTKVKPLTQPRFWGSMGVTAVVVAFIWEVSEHPEWFELDDLKEAISNSGNFEDRLSQEERSIAADIDSSALLLEELEGPELLPFPMDAPINAGEGVLDDVRKSRLDRPATPQTSSNPLLQQSPSSNNSLPDFPVPPTPSDTNNILNFNSAPPTPSSPTPSPQDPSTLTPPLNFDANYPGVTANEGEASADSPLRAAMDQYTQEQPESNPSDPSSQTADSIDPILNFNQPQVNSVNTPSGQPTTSTPPNAATQPTVAIPPATWVVPRTATTPATPTTPTPTTNSYQTNISTTPPVIPSQPVIPPTRTGAPVTPDIQNIYNSYGAYPNVNSNGSYGAPYPNNSGYSRQAYPGYSNNNSTNPQDYQVNQNTLLQNSPGDQFNQMNQQRSYSVPRPIPGRRIGGGEINTFANP